MRPDTAVFLASAMLVANVINQAGCHDIRRDVIEVLRSPRVRCVLLWLPAPNSTDLKGWMSRLPFPVQLWTTFQNRQMRSLKDYAEESTKVFVLVPHSSASLRIGILTRLRSNVMYLSTVRWLFFLRPGERLPYEDYPEVSCMLVSVNLTRTLDMPVDGYRNCAHRKTNPPDALLHVPTKRTLSQLHGKSLIVADKILFGGKFAFPPGNYSYPTVLVITSTLKYLNVSLLPSFIRPLNAVPDQVSLDIMKKDIDLIVNAPMQTMQRYRFVNVEAVVEPIDVLFYSAGKSEISQNLVQSIFVTGPLGVLLLLSAFIFVVIHMIEAQLMKRPTENSNIFFFLLSIVLTRCTPLPRSAERRATKFLLMVWMFTITGISSYIQSAITSESSIPPLTSSIETIADLEEALQSGKVLPCVREHDYGHQFIESSHTRIATRLKTLIRLCNQSCIAGMDGAECFQRTSKGTHVFVDVSLGVIDYREAIANNLAESKESLTCTYTSVLTHKSFTLATEIHYLTRLVAQSGLTDFLRRWEQMEYRHRQEPSHKISVNFALKEHLLAYVYAVVACTFVLLLETVYEPFVMFMRPYFEKQQNTSSGYTASPARVSFPSSFTSAYPAPTARRLRYF